MFHHILVPTDGSPLSGMAIEKSVALAKSLGARITFLTAVEPFHIWTDNANQLAYTREEYERISKESAGGYLDSAVAAAEAAGVAVGRVQVETDEPYRAIIDAAVERGCDLVAMASHGRRGVAALVIGSETQKVLTHSAIPVLVYR
ncbi:universal stress protein [Kaistia algarum]|uniref:universal stress protein n=1 Tax=Kaistia algarum TaxID=2083279 RepID=UPI000CE829F5|nr:universal stress protein [Kaistia algarum]MCX5512630.1 universal stress protein [Kaistia algarum]PPE81853.1 universal stress protein [Kaistia algarum]